MRPTKEECPEYYNYYVGLTKQDDVVTALTESKKEVLEFIKSISTDLENYAYAENKWTVKEVLIHAIDTERIFSTRALGFARGESQKPHSYDENIYAANSNANSRTLKDITEEFDAVRNSSICLFKSFSNETLNKMGEVPSGLSSINAIGFTICGHTMHHIHIIKDRYFKNNFTIKN